MDLAPGEKRWYAASIIRVAKIALNKTGEDPSDENIRSFVQRTWQPITIRKGKLLRGLAMRLRNEEIAKESKKHLESGRSTKSIERRVQLDIIGRYKESDDDPLELIGDIIFPEK